MLAAVAILFPVGIVVGLLLFVFLRKSPERRARILFVKIVHHPLFHPGDLPKIHDAVRDCDITYLKAYLRGLGPR